MNAAQRVVLFSAVITSVAVIYLTPRVVIIKGMVLSARSGSGLANVVDVRTVGAELGGVVVVAIFLWLAFAAKRRSPDRLSVVEDGMASLTKDIAALESHATDPSPSKRQPSV